jgi:hypothetical protein
MSEHNTYSSTTEKVECPWCGHKNKLTDLYSDLQGPEEAKTECYECEKPFEVSFSLHISVVARRP